MGKRGPEPKAKLSVVDFRPKDKVNAPESMTGGAKELFEKIIAENTAESFDSESLALLRTFCEADFQHIESTKRLNEEGAVLVIETRYGPMPRTNPWFAIQRNSASLMGSISTKLRAKGVKFKPDSVKKKTAREGLMFNG